MSERIPEETVDDIRRKSDIVDVIGDYVQLKKQGRNYFGLCPFHGENSPSFSVSPEKQIFHCFGCGAGGNVYTFLMDHEGYSFQQAVSELGSRVGVEVTAPDRADDPSPEAGKGPHADQLEAHELLAKFYHHLLMNTDEGQEALEYLYARGFTEAQLKTFKVGWALPQWDFIAKMLETRSFNLSSMAEAGLVIKRDDGSYFDRFRGRIIFPIENERGQIVAFSGRVLKPGPDEPKYLNSPETPLFQKNKILFNFHRARGAIRREHSVVLFEGFADVIASNEVAPHGIATMGTALSDQHIQMLKRLTGEVIVCYDGDQAGIEAAYKASGEIASKGLAVKIAMLPKGMDPDDYMQKNGGESFRKNVIDASVSLMAFKMHYHRSGKNLSTEDGRIEYIQSVLKEIATLKGAVEKELYLKQLSNETDVSYPSLEEQLQQVRPSRQVKQVQQEQPSYEMDYMMEPPPPEGEEEEFQPSKPVLSVAPKRSKMALAYENSERYLIAHMLASDEIAYTVQTLLNGETLNKDDHQAIYTYLLTYYEQGHTADPGAFVQTLEDRHLRMVATEIHMMEVNPEVSRQELHDYVKEVLNYPKMLKIKEKEQEARQQTDHRRAAEIAMEIIALRKSLKR